jgi:hypothetical protein
MQAAWVKKPVEFAKAAFEEHPARSMAWPGSLVKQVLVAKEGKRDLRP